MLLIFRLQPNRFTESRLGLRIPTEPGEHGRQVDLVPGVVWIEANGFAVTSFGVIDFALAEQSVSEEAIAVSLRWVQSNCFAEGGLVRRYCLPFLVS